MLKIFRLFNTNDDGKLTKNELYHGLIKYYNEEDIRKEINDIYFMLDGADRGFLEFEEFLRACLDKKKLLSDENLLYAFNFFDKDFTGKISVDKIKATFVENSVKKRFELRKTYVHYDEKMEKWVKERNIKFNKGKEESISDIQKFESNEKNND